MENKRVMEQNRLRDREVKDYYLPEFKTTKPIIKRDPKDSTFSIQQVPKVCTFWINQMGPCKDFKLSTKCNAWIEKESPKIFSANIPSCSLQTYLLLHANSTFHSMQASLFPFIISSHLPEPTSHPPLLLLLPKQRPSAPHMKTSSSQLPCKLNHAKT